MTRDKEWSKIVCECGLEFSVCHVDTISSTEVTYQGACDKCGTMHRLTKPVVNHSIK